MTETEKLRQGSFWKDRRVLVTGHTGFKGGWLSLWLARQGALVSGLALPPAKGPNLFEAIGLDGQMDSSFIDIRDAEALSAALKRIQPEIIFHLAAQPLVRRSYQEPAYTYAVNVMGTIHLLEAARSLGSVRAILVVTSDKCYENRNWTWPYRENDPMGGYDPYSSSKGCAELVVGAWRNSFFAAQDALVLGSARAGNVVGGGDWSEDRLIPDCIRAFEQGQPVNIRYPNAVRPWQHVLEPLHGYMQLAEQMFDSGRGFGEAWNFGPNEDDAWPVGRIVGRLSSLWSRDARWIATAAPQPHEAAALRIDSSKARARLRWKPLLDLDTVLGWTVDWYRRHANADALRATHEQIDRYEELAARKLAQSVPLV